jgi:hypothetical protein
MRPARPPQSTGVEVAAGKALERRTTRGPGAPYRRIPSGLERFGGLIRPPTDVPLEGVLDMASRFLIWSLTNPSVYEQMVDPPRSHLPP